MGWLVSFGIRGEELESAEWDDESSSQDDDEESSSDGGTSSGLP